MLISTFYTGENHNFTFKKYVHLHKDAHTILEDLTADQYPGLDLWFKVKHLVDGIKTYALEIVKATIW